MQTIKEHLKRWESDKNGSGDGRKRVKYQFQEIALDLIEKFGAKGKEKTILFAFIKRKLDKGMWWKVKEVSEYMDQKGIKSARYFMACFRKNMNIDKTKKEISDIIELWNSKEVKKRDYAKKKLQMLKPFIKEEVYKTLSKKMNL
jgi:hypothetical protein